MPVAAMADDDPLPPAPTISPRASAAAAAMREARERRLRDEQRAVEGRIQTLDRKLDLKDIERSQAPRIQPNGVPEPLQDPVADRLRQERRGLLDRDRLLEQRLRNEQFDRERVQRMRAW